MERSQDWIRLIKDKLSDQGINPSDYRLAKITGLTASAISHYQKRIRQGKEPVFRDEVGIRIADFLEVDRAYVLASLAAERSQDPDVVATWERVGQLVQRVTGTARRGAAAILAGILMSYGITSPDQAVAGAKNFEPVIYIIRTYRRIRGGWCAALWRWLANGGHSGPLPA